MPMRPYPDDRQDEPDQLTLSDFVQEASQYYLNMRDSQDAELTFLKFVLAGRRGLDREEQRSITLNTTQGQPNLRNITTTRDYDSLIGTTRTLPYKVALTVWPVPSFRDTLRTSNHVNSVAYDRNGNPIHVPMHSIPNVALGKVANRSIVRVFFPRMFSALGSRNIPTANLESIYNRCLRPTIQRLMRNQATHWPPSYQTALETGRDRSGRLHFRSLDISAHLLAEFSRLYLAALEELGNDFKDAYFGHELRGWKAATVHNLDANPLNQDDAPQEDLSDSGPVHEHVAALDDLTRVLDLDAIHLDQWLIDVGLEFGIPGKVVTWRALGHEALVHFLIPDLEEPGRVLSRSRDYYQDPQMHLKDISGFRWSPGSHSDLFKYIQAYTTEKDVSYQLHTGIFSHRKASELLDSRQSVRLIKDLEQQSLIIHACTGDADQADDPEVDQIPQEGCARLEVRVSLADANYVLNRIPNNLVNHIMVQVPASHWWYFKWLRLAAVHAVITNLCNAPGKHRSSDSSLALGAIAVWILNGAHHTPVNSLVRLAKQACSHILAEEDVDPEDPDAITSPLMYEAGTYFICDIVADSRTHVYRIPYAKEFDTALLLQAYQKGTMNELQRILGGTNVQTGRPMKNTERTSNRTSKQTMDVRHFRPEDRPIPSLGRLLNGLPLPDPPVPRGPDVDYYRLHGGGNRQVEAADDEPQFREDPENPLKNEVQVILEQMFFDIIQLSPNKRAQTEGAWTNIPPAFRHEVAVEDLYLHFELPFHAVQYIVCPIDRWAIHFDRFFPPTPPKSLGQNFKNATYMTSYLNILNRLPSRQLTLVRRELRKKFDTLFWIPYTESDRMWSTQKMAKWESIPKGCMEGPKIALNPLVFARVGGRPKLRDPPVLVEPEQEEQGGERGGYGSD